MPRDPASAARHPEHRGRRAAAAGAGPPRSLAGAEGPGAARPAWRPAKAHPYLVSFGKLGLIEQDPASGRYGLGPLAMQLGLISLQQLDPVALATPVIEPPGRRNAARRWRVAVWGNRGATIVRMRGHASAVHVTDAPRHGDEPARHCASGRLFAAWLPRAAVLQALREEARTDGRPKGGPRGIDTDFAAALGRHPP
ncbi:MAG: hypothetical protein MZW92_13050 [Comamonadaceae bacterium]|nr:hypothetical protein [Comamonadaceae bacterium]